MSYLTQSLYDIFLELLGFPAVIIWSVVHPAAFIGRLLQLERDAIGVSYAILGAKMVVAKIAGFVWRPLGGRSLIPRMIEDTFAIRTFS